MPKMKAYVDLAVTMSEESVKRFDECILKHKIMLNEALQQHYKRYWKQERGESHYDFPGENPSWQMDQIEKNKDFSCYPLRLYNDKIFDLSKEFRDDVRKGKLTEFFTCNPDECDWQFTNLTNGSCIDIIKRDDGSWDFCVAGLLPIKVQNPPEDEECPSRVWHARIRRMTGGEMFIDIAMKRPDMIMHEEMEKKSKIKTRKVKREAWTWDDQQLKDSLAMKHGIDPSEFDELISKRIWEDFQNPVIEPVDGEDGVSMVTEHRPGGAPKIMVKNVPEGKINSVKVRNRIDVIFNVVKED